MPNFSSLENADVEYLRGEANFENRESEVRFQLYNKKSELSRSPEVKVEEDSNWSRPTTERVEAYRWVSDIELRKFLLTERQARDQGILKSHSWTTP